MKHIASIVVRVYSSCMDAISDYCAAGGSLGGLVYIIRCRLYERENVISVLVLNTGIALLFSPVLIADIICPWLGVEPSFRICMAFSGAIGLGAPWVMDHILPLLGAKLESLVKDLNLRSLLARLLRMKEEENDRRSSQEDRGSGGTGQAPPPAH